MGQKQLFLKDSSKTKLWEFTQSCKDLKILNGSFDGREYSICKTTHKADYSASFCTSDELHFNVSTVNPVHDDLY